MTQTEKDQKLAELKAQMEALDATPVTTYKVWEPEHGEVYFFTPTLNYFHYDSRGDKKAKNAGLAHPTKEAAERHHSFLVMLHDLHKFAVEHNEGWKQEFKVIDVAETIGFDHSKQKLEPQYVVDFQISILPHFKPELGLAQKAIDTFGDRLKILFEYYNS